MPPLAAELGRHVDEALSLAHAAETVRGLGQPAANLFHVYRLEAIYELALLRIFTNWEVFLEETFLRYLCGYESAAGPASLLGPPELTLQAARTKMLNSADFVSWQRVDKVIRRCQKFMTPFSPVASPAGSHEGVLLSNRARLENFAAVRNRIAHLSQHARDDFDQATMQLAGRRYAGSRPGRFLRDWNAPSSPRQRWLRIMGEELKNLSVQIAP